MSNFTTKEEKKISNEFEKQGYLIRNIDDKKSIKKIFIWRLGSNLFVLLRFISFRSISRTYLKKFRN